MFYWKKKKRTFKNNICVFRHQMHFSGAEVFANSRAHIYRYFTRTLIVEILTSSGGSKVEKEISKSISRRWKDFFACDFRKDIGESLSLALLAQTDFFEFGSASTNDAQQKYEKRKMFKKKTTWKPLSLQKKEIENQYHSKPLKQAKTQFFSTFQRKQKKSFFEKFFFSLLYKSQNSFFLFKIFLWHPFTERNSPI